MIAKAAKILTLTGILMLLVGLGIDWDMGRHRLNPMGDPEFRFMMKVVGPWNIVSIVVFLAGCCALAFTATCHNLLRGGGALAVACLIFPFTMSLWVNIHGWTGSFLEIWAVASVAVLILLGVALGRLVVHRP